MRSTDSFSTLSYLGKQVVAVETEAGRIGYVRAAGTVYVALAGARYDLAIEVGQSIVIEKAIGFVMDAATNIGGSAPAATDCHPELAAQGAAQPSALEYALEVALWFVALVHEQGRCTRREVLEALQEHFGPDTSLDAHMLKYFRKAHRGLIRYNAAGTYWESLLPAAMPAAPTATETVA